MILISGCRMGRSTRELMQPKGRSGPGDFDLGGCGIALRLSHLSCTSLGILLMPNYSSGVSHHTLLPVRYLVHLSTLRLDSTLVWAMCLSSGNKNVSASMVGEYKLGACVYPSLLPPPIAKIDIEVTTRCHTS